jgi:hypothetical protein
MKINLSCFGIHFLFFYLLLFSLFISKTILAGENPKKKTYNWEVHLSLGTMYDNNILKYSDKYIERFINSEDEGRFHISSYDDIVLPYSIGVSYKNDIIGDLKTIFSAGYNSNAYSYNGIKNWAQYNFHWRQYVAKSTSIHIFQSFTSGISVMMIGKLALDILPKHFNLMSFQKITLVLGFNITFFGKPPGYDFIFRI